MTPRGADSDRDYTNWLDYYSNLPVVEPCTHCMGEGVDPHDDLPCPVCSGAGLVERDTE